MPVTRITNKDSIAVGLAKLYLAPYASYEADTTSVLTGSEYFGAVAEIELTCNKTFVRQSKAEGNVLVTLENFLTAASISVSCSFIEITAKNMAIALGGDGTSPNFMQSIFANPAILRAEMKFVYPNKINELHIILPKVQVVTSSVPVSFNASEALSMPLQLSVLASDHANWVGKVYGQPVFV